MKITNEILFDALHCMYKVHNKINKDPFGPKPDIVILHKKLKETHKAQFEKRFIDHLKLPANTSAKTPRSKTTLTFNSAFTNDHIDLTFDAIETTTGKNKIVTILTVPSERVSKADRMFLAAQTHLLCLEFPEKVDNCKIIFGENFRSAKFKFSSFKKRADKLLISLKKVLSASTPPDLYKNNHCQSCQFQQQCLKTLRERDDLSLLSGIKLQDIVQRRNRGIFNVRQLAFTYRARKNPFRSRKYFPELKALAIRDGKTYIQENWSIPRSKAEVFLDIEGIPDRNFNYLVGAVIRTNGSEDTYSFWADDKASEREIFLSLIKILSSLEEFIIYHYGVYEQQAIRNISKSMPDHLPFLTKMLQNCVNVLSFFTESIYPPTYSNGLKEIANYLNFEWTEKKAGGLQSIVWRYDWEFSRTEIAKQKLLQYNNEDCKALMKVFDWICTISLGNRIETFLPKPKQNIYKWGITDYAFDDFAQINSKAYFSYQRHHIFLRGEKKVNVRKATYSQQLRIYNKPQRRVSLFPAKCVRCKSSDLMVLHTAQKIQLDLTFMKTGLKSSIIRYSGGPFMCKKCNGKFKGGNMRRLPRYGLNLMIWSVNQKIQYHLSSESVINVLRDSLKIDVSPTQMTRFKEVVAQRYANTYKEIIKKLTQSKLIHIDETIARIKGVDGYVWVFANHECVYYEFRETREADFLKNLLGSFDGTLVTDFYAGYDSIECKQQKCLIHLIRDMNEDYLKNQFDIELKMIVLEFGKLLRRIVATIDRYGLRKLHLNKHRRHVKTFYIRFINKDFESEVAQSYKRRLLKYREKMFGFLTEDDIPWNNNNAEHSIKPFAKWRKRKTSNLSVNNIRNHLILLSILQTCKYNGMSFFEFMRSGELSLFK